MLLRKDDGVSAVRELERGIDGECAVDPGAGARQVAGRVRALQALDLFAVGLWCK